MRSDPFSDLIQQIYDTALDPARWPDTLSSVSSHIGAQFMSVVPYSNPSLIFMSKGGEEAMKGYTEHWFKFDAMVEVGIKNKHDRGLLCDWSSIGIKEINNNAYYQDFRKSRGLGFCIGSTFEAYPGDFRALGINLPLGVEPLDSARLKTIDDVLRHLARAITISSRMMQMITLPDLAETLERIQCGAAVVDGTGRVIIANGILASFRNDGVELSSDRIQCRRAACQRSLNQMLAKTMADSSIRDDMDFVLIDRPSGRKPFMARALPLSNRSMEMIWGKPATCKQALLLVVDLAADEDLSCEAALMRLGLTAAESKVAALVGGGLSPRQVACQLGNTEGTVRGKLKQIFAKMNLSRQSDLVRLLNQVTKLR